MERVVVSRPFLGLLYMQVCACNDATDEEMLEVANRKNPSGTSMGWCNVIRTIDQCPNGRADMLPGPCDDHPQERKHFLINC